jgi:hypothetical protein
MKLSALKLNPKNPRTIKGERYDKLVKSIKEFPKMMKLRPIVVDNDNMVLGGNMRLKALKDLGYKEIPDEWVKKADELTEDEAKRFIIADNVGFGEHDFEALKEWDQFELSEWGIEFQDESTVDMDMLDSNGNLSGQNYGDVGSKNKIPFNILGIGGMLEKEVAEKLKQKLVEYGCIEGEDNSILLNSFITSVL